MNTSIESYVHGVTQANKQAVDAVVRFGRIASRAQGLLARQQFAAFENCLEAGSKNLRLVTQTRDPKALLSGQTQVVAELGEQLMAVAQESVDIQNQARDEFAGLVEEGLARASKVAKGATDAPVKAARRARKVA